jgi:hypothetical protein
VFFSAILLILLASFFHSWYAGNAGASVSQVAFGFIWYGSYVLPDLCTAFEGLKRG